MLDSLIIDWESLNTYDNDGKKIVKEIPIYKTGIYKGKLWLDKKGNPLCFIENLGLSGRKLAWVFFDIWDENTGASAKKVRVVDNNNLKDLLMDSSKWGEEQLIEIVGAKTYRSGRRYQRIYLLPVPK